VPESMVRIVHVECVCGWKFATINLVFAESIMRRHQCENFIATGKDDQAFDIIEEMG
jgi:dihydrodipicolinate synthase/N-acetylneuraminate lyase